LSVCGHQPISAAEEQDRVVDASRAIGHLLEGDLAQTARSMIGLSRIDSLQKRAVKDSCSSSKENRALQARLRRLAVPGQGQLTTQSSLQVRRRLHLPSRSRLPSADRNRASTPWDERCTGCLRQRKSLRPPVSDTHASDRTRTGGLVGRCRLDRHRRSRTRCGCGND
jgi:hypothetical protein